LPLLVCCFSRRLLFAGAAVAGSLHLALMMMTVMSPRSDDAIISIVVERRDRRHSHSMVRRPRKKRNGCARFVSFSSDCYWACYMFFKTRACELLDALAATQSKAEPNHGDSR
jgi:hypothetical protein